METNEMDFPGQQEGFNAKLLGIESIIEKALQKNGNLTLNFFLSPVGQHVEKTESAHVWMKKEDGMECQTLGKNAKSESKVSSNQILNALAECKKKGYIWGKTAYGIAFCVCRDAYSQGDNIASFERMLINGGIKINPGTIYSAIYRNNWMKYHITKWESMGVSDRVIILRDEIMSQLDDALNHKKTA